MRAGAEGWFALRDDLYFLFHAAVAVAQFTGIVSVRGRRWFLRHVKAPLTKGEEYVYGQVGVQQLRARCRAYERRQELLLLLLQLHRQ